MWRIDPLLGKDLETYNETTAVAKQQPVRQWTGCETSLEFSSVVRRWPAGHGVSAEAEESPLLEAVTRERLVKTE
jgi:hypothetical protein